MAAYQKYLYRSYEPSMIIGDHSIKFENGEIIPVPNKFSLLSNGIPCDFAFTQPKGTSIFNRNGNASLTIINHNPKPILYTDKFYQAWCDLSIFDMIVKNCNSMYIVFSKKQLVGLSVNFTFKYTKNSKKIYAEIYDVVNDFPFILNQINPEII